MIHAEHLTKYYGTLCAVNDISFEVPRGEILGLLGPNGAGKSTTMKMVTGFLRPSAGSVRIAGQKIDEFPLEGKARIGYLPEFAPLYSEMMVYDYLGFIARIREVEKKRIPEELRRVSRLCGLGGVMHQGFSELSRGYRQRVGLAHAIVGDPEILILDEPTSGLDPNQIVEIRSLIKTIGAKKSVIFSTHVLSEAEATCDRIVIIHKGSIVSDGPPASLRQAIKGESVVMLTLEGTTFEEASRVLSSLKGVTDVALAPGDSPADTVRMRLTCDEEARRTLHRRIKAEPWLLLELNVEQQSLEEAFRELTGHQIKGQIDGN